MDDSACPQIVSNHESILYTPEYVHVPKFICRAHLPRVPSSKKAFPTLITMETREAFCYIFEHSNLINNLNNKNKSK